MGIPELNIKAQKKMNKADAVAFWSLDTVKGSW